jgi:hypothetical protein
MDAEMKVTGIDILVQISPGRDPYVINTVRDAGTVFLPDGYVTGTMAAERRSGR